MTLNGQAKQTCINVYIYKYVASCLTPVSIILVVSTEMCEPNRSDMRMNMIRGDNHSSLGSMPIGLTLVSAPHLARSFHHLFPLDAFQESPLEELTGERYTPSLLLMCV